MTTSTGPRPSSIAAALNAVRLRSDTKLLAIMEQLEYQCAKACCGFARSNAGFRRIAPSLRSCQVETAPKDLMCTDKYGRGHQFQ